MRLGNAHIVLLLLAAGLLAGACTRVEPVGQEQDEIRFRVNGWQEATKAGAVPYAGGTISSGSFGVTAYFGDDTTPYIENSTVNCVTSAWEFADGKHYWPASGNLDFHAWMPVTPPSYIGSLPYSTANGPGFTCTDLPLTSAGQEGLQEYVYAYETGKNKGDSGASGVSLTFSRPFAMIRFHLTDIEDGMTLTSITLSTVNNSGVADDQVRTGGVYTHTRAGGWSSLTGRGRFEGTYSQSSAPADLGEYLVVPQSFNENTQHIEVTLTPTSGVGSSVTYGGNITLPAWEKGYQYTYNFFLRTSFLVTVEGLENVDPVVTAGVEVDGLIDAGTKHYVFLIIVNSD